MKQARTWPSKRLQLVVIAILIVGAALRVFWQPISPEARARKLYLDSWFVGTGAIPVLGEIGGQGSAAEHVERALKLDPGNSLYEQALVWQYPRAKLPELLKKRRLGPEARRLAAGLIAASPKRIDPSRMPPPPGDEAPEAADLRAKLASLTEFEEADPTNSLVRYRRAQALQELGRMDEALSEMKVAGKLGPLRFYYPRVPAEVSETASAPMVTSPQFGSMAELRRLTLACTDLANDRLRHGKVSEAREILDACRRMGANTAASEPPTYIGFLVAKAMHEITMAELRPLTDEFGTKDEKAGLRRLDDAYQNAFRACRDWIASSDSARDMMLPSAVPGVIGLAVTTSLVVLLATAFLWLAAVLIRERRAQAAEVIPPWERGFLARLFLASWLPVIVVSLPAVYLAADYLYNWDPMSSNIAQPVTVAAICLVQVLVLVLVLRVLHHRYDLHTGERSGIVRFVLKAPASAKAWTWKYIIVGLMGQLVFLACCLLLATIVYKPIFGGHPWETTRFRLSYVAHEQEVARQVAADIGHASLALDGK